MKIDRLMKRYYQAKLDKIPAAEKPGLYPENRPAVSGRPFLLILENVLGFVVTAAYFLQFLMPDNWFSLSRIVFRIGF